MKPHNMILRQIVSVLIGVTLGTAAAVGIFVLLGYYDRTVLLGSIAGALLAIANFFLMALGTHAAANKAEQQDVKGGQALIHMSYIGRMIGLFVILILCAKSGYCHPLALVIPLVFVRPALTVAEILKRKGDKNQ